MLSKNDFYDVVRKTPLVAVDFIIMNEDNKVLLGKRNNNPAKGDFFTFGAVIAKNESIDAAKKRMLKNELGIILKKSDDVKFLGIFEQFYDNNFKDEKTNTHYIILSFTMKINPKRIKENKDEHTEIAWFDSNEVLKDKTINKNVKTLLKFKNEANGK